jgi:hypothetical protein
LRTFVLPSEAKNGASGRATWTAKLRRVAASESGDERVQSRILLPQRWNE